MTITMNQFLDKYLGKRVDKYGKDRGRSVMYTITNSRGQKVNCGFHQCASLINVYCREVFGVEIGAFGGNGGAINGFRNNSTFPSNDFEYFNATSGFVPQPGDIVFIEPSAANYSYGHIGIVISANSHNYQILEQNAGSGLWYGEGGDAITIRTKYYTEVRGYHRFKGGRLSRSEIAKIIFMHMSGSDYYNGKNASAIWNGNNPNSTITRSEVANMIINMFNKVLYRNVSYNQLISYGVWNGERPNDIVTDYELDLMLDRVRFI